MTKAIIIDDDIRFANILREMILKKCRMLQWPIEVTASDRPMDAIDAEARYDIYFIDISMPEMMGIDLVKRLKEHFIYREFVFVSSYSYYMRETMFVRPRAFIRKEHLDKDLDETLTILKEILCRSETEVTVKDNLKDITIMPAKVVYIRSDEHYLTLYDSSGETLVVRNRLAHLEESLKPYGFLRIHSRYLINLNYLEDRRDQLVRLTDNISLPISRNYRKRVCDAVMNWMAKDEV